MTVLAGRNAYVTGGGRGIGRGIAVALAQAGANVMVADFNSADARAVAGEIESLGRRGASIEMDVTVGRDTTAMVAETVSRLGHLDIAVNCAGVIGISSVDAMSEAEWDRVMDVNVKGVFLCCKAALPELRKSKNARIINIASISGKEGYPNASHYCASKFAVIGFTNSLAKEVAKDNMTANAICPGIVRTQMWDILVDGLKEAEESREAAWERVAVSRIPLGRPQSVEDIGALAVFLASPGAANLTGQAINVDGGLLAH